MKIKQFVFNMVGESTFIVWDELTKDAAVIDAGMYDNEERQEIADFVRKEGLNLCMALQTHMHFDHIFGLQFIFDTYGLRPICHSADEQLYYQMPEMIRMFGIREPLLLPKPLRYIADGETFRLGNIEIKAIHTPGHTPGGTCYYIEQEATLFSGDTLFCQSIGRTDLPGGDYKTEIESIQKKLFVLPSETKVYPGHGPFTTIGAEKYQFTE